MLALFNDALDPRTQVSVVDLHPEAVEKRLAKVGIGNVHGVAQPGTAEFDALLLRLEQTTSALLDRRALAGLNPNCYAEVATPDRRRWPVLAVARPDRGRVVLEVAGTPSDDNVATIHPSPESVRASTIRATTEIHFADGRTALPFRMVMTANTSDHSHIRIEASLPV